MPANKMTQQEIEFFPDVAHGSQSAMLEFLYIRNRLLQMWINNPGSELTAEKAQNTVVLPQSGQDGGVCTREREGERGGEKDRRGRGRDRQTEREREGERERDANSQS